MFKTSESVDSLYSALVDAQAQMPMAKKSSKSRFHTYATLNDLIMGARPALSKYGLAVTQGLTYYEGKEFITTRLIHKPSGQWQEASIPVLPIPLAKEDIQSYCGHISYLQRYSYKLMVGILADDDEDDDGQTAMKSYTSPAPVQFIAKEQIDQLEYELQDHPDIKKKLLQAYALQSLAQLPKHKFLQSLERVRQIKRDSSLT